MEALCNNNTIPELTKREQEMCEEVITEKEYYESLSRFKKVNSIIYEFIWNGKTDKVK